MMATEHEVTISGVDGALAGALVVPPGPPAGAVVVLPEVDGYCPGTVAAARRLAASGYVALALDLFAPYGGTPELRGGEATMAWLSRLDDRRQLSDLAVACRWLQARPEVDGAPLAIVGFSIGGRYGMLLGCEPHGLAAVVAFYSRPWPGGAIAEIALAPGDHIDVLDVPVCAFFGAQDELVPPDMVERFRGVLTSRPEVGHEIHVVQGGHFFANESRPRRYRAESAEQAWGVALPFLARHLSVGT
jgi:carboxymethylenebutenolidase